MKADSRIPELDGLRGLAILLVLIFHVGILRSTSIGAVVNPLVRFGWSGVDLFFVLSGFLIGGILLDNSDSKRYFAPFYARRFFRILPIYMAVVGLYWLVWCIGPLRHDLTIHAGEPMPLAGYLSFTNNLWMAAHNNMEVFLSPSWSLAIEEQFYLTLPLLIRLVPRRRLLLVVVSALLAVTGARWAVCAFGAVTQAEAYVLPMFRVDSLLVGVLCAMLVRWERGREWLDKRAWLLVIPVLLGAFAVWNLDLSLPPQWAKPNVPIMMYGLTLVALGYASLLLLALARPQWGIGALLRTGALRFLGRVSYFVYLVHWGILHSTATLMRELAPSAGEGVWLAAMAASVGVMLGIAELSWRFFESRMLAIGHRVKYTEVPRKDRVQPVAISLSEPRAIGANDASALGQTSEAA
ncbi:MAG TPA: acyltransferase [Candidatus Acidoferrales bacterium]|nr:acyltransferase [Candidatus Acidoferrales bacterium]